MGSTLIMTSCWSVDATVTEVWKLLISVRDWPRWWTSVEQVQIVPSLPLTLHRRPVTWSALLGRPLRLRGALLTSQPMELIEWQWRGDIVGRATWVLNPTEADGADITCRWELHLDSGSRSLLNFLASSLLERCVFAVTRRLAQDMGRTLRCRVSPLREWQGRGRQSSPVDER